ncbi:MAG TPA: biotin/lipoyl-containing protein [Acetobacteraceae bacterium]|nr:biotin/lipoyl-containing protein [Acetobacteraceae bacterium]
MEAGETEVHHRFDLDGEINELWLSRGPAGYHLQIADGWSGSVALIEERAGHGRLVVDGKSEQVAYVVDGDVVHIHCRGRAYAVRYVDPLLALASASDEAGHNVARAPMPGVVVSVKVTLGDTVAAGAVLMVIESMKLETPIRAPQDGVIERIHVRDGESFDRDAVLATLSQGNG